MDNNNNNNNNINSINDDNNNISRVDIVENSNRDGDNKSDKYGKLKVKLMKLSSKQSMDSTLGYNETLMHDHHSPMDDSEVFEEKKFILDPKQDPRQKRSSTQRSLKICCDTITSRTAQDWVFLTLLGVAVALFSFLIDVFTEKSLIAHRWLYWISSGSSMKQYVAWVMYPLVFIAFSAGFTNFVSPTAVGSGIPEVKTIMKGVVLKEYLTFKTLMAKVVGLTASLSSGVPIGKVGPFVHVASITASNLSKFFSPFRNIRENEALQIDILTAASAVGVSCTFAAPIGGVLFSVEATATYFAVRNYWRGFYSAMCGALTFRLLSSITKSEETLTALFKTELRQTLPYDVIEIIVFAFVGVVCGVFGAGFVWMHKRIVLFIKGRARLNALLKNNPFLYPCVVTFVIFSLTFPGGLGKYMAGELTLREAVNQMFDNKTWVAAEVDTIEDQRRLSVWRGPFDNVLLTICLFFFSKFWMCAFATTLPVPCGIFIPAFALGSSVGRFFGEVMAAWFPGGIRGKMIVPGAYSLVGAATFSGAVTHTVSPAVIVFELTGHLGHLLPTVIAVMVASATANFIQPSVYDAMIEIKKLPFLPARIDPDACDAHKITAEDIMTRDVRCVTKESSTYRDILSIVTEFKYRAYPVTVSEKDKKLIGSVLRTDLKRLLLNQLTIVLPTTPVTPSSPPSPPGNFELDKMSDIAVDHPLNRPFDLDLCNVDPAPFQISSNTSLYRIHWLFSLLGLHRAFVVHEGRIVGVISLAEIRKAVECQIKTSNKR